jgi:hypothetical protein
MQYKAIPHLTRKAQCCCGQLSVEVFGEPEIYGICHCNNCKQRTGSSFGVSAYFRNSNIIGVVGGSSEFSFHHKEKDHDQTRHFCHVCGTTLFWFVSSMPELTGIAGGCFTANALGVPNYSTSHDNMCSWLELPETVETNA